MGWPKYFDFDCKFLMDRSHSIPGAGWSTVFQMNSQKTLAVPASIHVTSRLKLCENLAKLFSVQKGILIFEGGDQGFIYDTDGETIFRQDSWFQYLFGVKEPGFFGGINVANQKAFLFIPRLPDEYRLWCGKIYPPEYFKELYKVDEVLFVDEIEKWIQTQDDFPTIYLLEGINSDSGFKCKPANLPNISSFKNNIDKTILHTALALCRVTKSTIELSLLQYCAYVASMAHVQVMRIARPGAIEYEFEALFQYEIYKNGGCRNVAYTSICGCGPNSAVLHYGHAAAANTRQVEVSDIALLDMGADYHGYKSDITCSFPVSGKFSADQKVIYEAVLNAQIVVLNMIKPGVFWPNCHLAAEKEILKGLITAGILQGDLDAIVDAELGPTFFPHGLGHLIGCDTHDVGGYISGTPERQSRAGLKKLRTARMLEQGMVLTVEPGCYFIDFLIEQALNDPSKASFINTNVLARFRSFGGIRLEDDVTVTEDGVENFTLCPRSVEEVESVMSGEKWPPSQDKLPELRRKWSKLSLDCTKMVPISLN